MYGDLATKLVLEAKRTTHLSELPLYQTDTVKDILKEISDLDQDAQYLTEQQQTQDDSLTEEEYKINQCQLFVTHLSMRRNKRCLLAYERLRSTKIDEFCWLNIDPISVDDNNSNNNNNNNNNRPIATTSTTMLSLDNLNHSEQEYYKNYQDLLIKYKSNFMDLDLSGDLQPPTNIFIDVRVLKNGGEVQTEYGSFNLIKNSQFYVRKSDVERLIQQGYMEEL